MPERKYPANAYSFYRYGFNGKENDNDVKGEGNQQDYGMRIYDPRLGRFLSVDPLTKTFPWYTPYQFAGNTPVQAIDLDGEEEKHYRLTLSQNGKSTLKLMSTKEYNDVPTWLRVMSLGLGPKRTKISERAVVSYEDKNYYSGFAGSYGRGNENGMSLFREFEQDPIAPVFPLLFLDESKSYNVELFSIGIQIQNNAAMYGALSQKAWYTRKLEDAATASRVYRTQGGSVPNASKQRISINQGGMEISGDEMLYVTLNDKNHQIYFYQKRGGAANGAEIVSFEIPKTLADEIVGNAVSQAQGKANPGKPQLSDPTKSSSSYGLPKEYIDKLRQQAIKGTGKIETSQ